MRPLSSMMDHFLQLLCLEIPLLVEELKLVKSLFSQEAFANSRGAKEKIVSSYRKKRFSEVRSS